VLTNGANAGYQVNSKTSRCANMISFSYGVASMSSESSPCSNVPVKCSLCPNDGPAVWRYSMKQHIKEAHPYVSLDDYGVWKVSKVEQQGIKKVWDKRHRKIKSRVWNKASKAPFLVKSETTSLTGNKRQPKLDARLADWGINSLH